MLILTRRPGESIRIGSNIVVRIGRIRGNQVQVSIEAPATVCITREELIPSSATGSVRAQPSSNIRPR